jgi:hypothetical protein
MLSAQLYNLGKMSLGQAALFCLLVIMIITQRMNMLF